MWLFLFLGLLPGICLCTFPTVDLGYARHAPTSANTTTSNTKYAIYRNIRFAQPPIGDLRFRRPVTPPPGSVEVQNGVLPKNSTNCVQTWPSWMTVIPGLNGTTWGHEDCLFLDIYVPEGLTEASASTGVPVLHWIYGGGYIFGAKDTGNDPGAILADAHPDEKFIVVASNYRLGPFGWMSSDTESSISQNNGLYDALAGLSWTKEYIHLFGGDPEKVTVIGQSAGGGIIEYLLAADAQGKDVHFNQAIISSPGYRPHVNRSADMTSIYKTFLNATDCDNAQCLRNLPEGELIKANAEIMLTGDLGPFGGPGIGFGPIQDGELASELPEIVFKDPKNHSKGKVKRIIAGGMKHDGIGNQNTTWKEMLLQFASDPSQSAIDSIANLYGNEKGFQTSQDKFYGDIIYECHSYLAAKYWADITPKCAPTKFQSYRYDQSIPKAFHGDDVNYYFYDEVLAKLNPSIVTPVAKSFQNYVRRFLLGKDMEDWPEFGTEMKWMNITADGFKPVVGKDEATRAKRCDQIVDLLQNNDGW